MKNSNIPFRVVWKIGTLSRTRLFSTLSEAEAFAKTVDVVIIQPANEAPPSRKRTHTIVRVANQLLNSIKR